MLNRNWIKVTDIDNYSIKVLQFNTLADHLSDWFPHTNPSYLKWEYRKERLIDIILENEPDIIGLEEVDHFQDWFEPKLIENGYQCYFYAKRESLDGMVIAFKESRFDIIEYKKEYYTLENSQGYIMARLYDKLTMKILSIFVTHLKAKPGFESIRSQQALKLVQEKNLYRSYGDVVLTFCDLNDIPNSDAYNVFQSNGYYSVYPSDNWTTWKQRETTVKRMIDYIWYDNDQTTIVEYLDIPSDEHLPQYLPASYYPSDHLAISAIIKINRNYEE